MKTNQKYLLLSIACALIIAASYIYLDARLHKARQSAAKYKANTEALLTEVEWYKVRDSLSDEDSN